MDDLDCRIVIADDHEILREGLKSLINREEGLSVVGEAGDGEVLLSLLADRPCDLVVLDLSMPHMDGMAALKQLRQQFPRVRVLILTMQKDAEHFKHAMAGGASGYVLKDDAYEQLVKAIKTVMSGKDFISPTVANLLTETFVRSADELESPSLEILTKREQQVLRCVAKGLPNKNIASKLQISIRTVETHRANLTHKLGIKSTAGLVKYALAKGLV